MTLPLRRKAASETALRELTGKYAQSDALQLAAVFAHRGDTDLALKWLERAYAPLDSGLAQPQ